MAPHYVKNDQNLLSNDWAILDTLRENKRKIKVVANSHRIGLQK